MFIVKYIIMSLSSSCIKRIARDVSEIHKNSLANNGIFYVQDEENIFINVYVYMYINYLPS